MNFQTKDQRHIFNCCHLPAAKVIFAGSRGRGVRCGEWQVRGRGINCLIPNVAIMCFAFALQQETNIFSPIFSRSLLFSLSPFLSLTLCLLLHIYSFFHLHIFNFNSESKRQMKLMGGEREGSALASLPSSLPICPFLRLSPYASAPRHSITMMFALAHYATHRPPRQPPPPYRHPPTATPNTSSALRVLSISSVFCSVALYGNQHTLQVLLLLL